MEGPIFSFSDLQQKRVLHYWIVAFLLVATETHTSQYKSPPLFCGQAPGLTEDALAPL